MEGRVQTRGLTSAEALDRRQKYGTNSVLTHRKVRPIRLLVKKFNSPLSLILVAAAVLSFFLSEKTDAVVILLMVIVSALVDFFNSYHSEKTVEQLEEKVATLVRVRRDQREQKVKTDDLVVGDVVLLAAGDVIPADLQLIETKDFFVDQASITGESFPVEKEASLAALAKSDLAIGNPAVALMGTSVVSGFGTGLVVQTGRQTEYGRIAQKLFEQAPETDFEREIRKFSYFIMKVTLVMVTFVFLINALFGHPLLESFLFAVAIAIGLTPELLPVIMSVSLSKGSLEMARQQVVVKKLSSIQNLGSMTVLCSDKTGTLTENKIVLVKAVDAAGQVSSFVLAKAALVSAFQTSASNPLDEAVKAATKVNLHDYQKIDELPFDFTRRRSSVLVRSGQAAAHLLCHGAPEALLKISTQVWQGDQSVALTTAERQRISQLFDQLSLAGFRTLALATKDVANDQTKITADMEQELTFVGLTVFRDPPKTDVKKTLLELEGLGVRFKLITGDSELLAKKVCEDAGIPVEQMLTGEQISRLSEEALRHQLPHVTLLARILPEQKEKIVTLLKATGEVVGFLGDGINDAPALRAADVGISVNNAVNVAKSAADIILLRSGLAVVADGVRAGRKTFQNTMKYILMGLSSDFGNAFSMSGASLVLKFLPMLPTQILLNDFLYDLSQLTIPTDNVDPEDIRRPLSWDFRFIKRYMPVLVVCELS